MVLAWPRGSTQSEILGLKDFSWCNVDTSAAAIVLNVLYYLGYFLSLRLEKWFPSYVGVFCALKLILPGLCKFTVCNHTGTSINISPTKQGQGYWRLKCIKMASKIPWYSVPGSPEMGEILIMWGFLKPQGLTGVCRYGTL